MTKTISPVLLIGKTKKQVIKEAFVPPLLQYDTQSLDYSNWINNLFNFSFLLFQ